MQTVMEHLVMFGAGSAATIAETVLEKNPKAKPKKMSLENYQNYLRKQAKYLKILKIVEYEILTYTAPSPTTMYKKVGCTEQQFLDAIDEKYKKYEEYIRRADYRKVIDHQYTKDPTPAPKKKPKLPAGVSIGSKYDRESKQICMICNDVLDEHNNLQCKTPKWKMAEV